ncbi:MAG: aminodeoxychorismate lyase, partial [Gammaproteobacteria bacterium]|nr:aminodeoxychorismate lyase [Gammaproteobacteria bacterium]NNJ83633.1 aminodeoxychorismate lyase [Gammaproteobacteria bacterium]
MQRQKQQIGANAAQAGPGAVTRHLSLVNGQPSNSISITDRGFQYGDGVFETLAVDNGAPLCLTDHLERLARGCRQLRIREPDRALLEEEIETVAGNLERGVLKIIISRGSSGRGYTPAADTSPTRVVAVFDWPDYPPEYHEHGVETFLCETHLGRNPSLAGIKHLNRLEQILARVECRERGLPEGIMADTDGNLIEGTMSNLFLVQGNELMTPILTHGGIRGIVRDRIIRLARSAGGIGVRELALPLAALHGADEVFFCNSLIGIWPVRRLEKYTYAAGPVARRLRAELLERRITCFAPRGGA